MAAIDRAIEPGGTIAVLRKLLFKGSTMVNAVGMAVLVLLMLLIAFDVILRYVFNSPIPGSLETCQYMLAILVAFGLAYTAMNKGHVTVDIFTSKLPPRAQLCIFTINCVFSLVLGALITWRLAAYGHMLQTGNITSSVLKVPMYPFVYAVAFGFAMLCLVFLYDTIENLVKFAKNSKWWSWLILIAATALLYFVCWMLIFNREALAISTVTAGIIGIVLLIVLLFSGMSLGMVMALVGFLGMSYVAGLQPAFASIGSSPYSTVSNYGFNVVPLFVLMGSFCFFSGISSDLYYAVYKWIGHFPGGLAMATIGACAGFAAICGSSVATVATMGTVAYPEMKRYRYDSKLATGCIAAGGGIGILIPPSLILAIYGILTEQSIGKLFLAGFIPGIIEAILLIITIYILCVRNPSLGPKGEVATNKERLISLKSVWPVLVLFILVIGGIYAGIFTATEAAGIGSFGAFVFAVARKKLTWKNFTASLLDTGNTTAMCFLIVIGATVLGYFLAITRLPHELTMFITTFSINRYLVFGIIFAIYFLLGMVMSSIAMVVLTVPIFYPIMVDLGFDPIWFGIIVVKVTEIAMITPPVGMNVFVMAGIAKDVPMYTIFKGIVPFLIAEFVNIGLLLLFPKIVTILPDMMRKPG